jgi:hypothetical protein
MSQPLDTKKKHSFEHSFSPPTQLSPLHVGCLVTPGRPLKVPFFGQERYVFMFLCEKLCLWTPSKNTHFLGGVSEFLCIDIRYPLWKYDFGCIFKITWWGSSNLEPERDSEEFKLCPPILNSYVEKSALFYCRVFRQPAT